MKKQDEFATLPGLAHVKRIMEIAVAGSYSIGILDCNGYNGEFQKAFKAIGGTTELKVTAFCPCGNFNHPGRACTCIPSKIKRWLSSARARKVFNSDIVIDSGYVRALDFDTKHNEPATTVKDRIKNMASANSELSSDAVQLLNRAYQQLNMTAAERDKAVRIATTIAGLDHDVSIDTRHIAEAIQYRKPL